MSLYDSKTDPCCFPLQPRQTMCISYSNDQWHQDIFKYFPNNIWNGFDVSGFPASSFRLTSDSCLVWRHIEAWRTCRHLRNTPNNNVELWWGGYVFTSVGSSVRRRDDAETVRLMKMKMEHRPKRNPTAVTSVVLPWIRSDTGVGCSDTHTEEDSILIDRVEICALWVTCCQQNYTNWAEVQTSYWRFCSVLFIYLSEDRFHFTSKPTCEIISSYNTLNDGG